MDLQTVKINSHNFHYLLFHQFPYKCRHLWFNLPWAVEGGANTLRALFTFEKYETINYDVCRMRRYRWNKLQWEENDMKRTKMPTGDYSIFKVLTE